MKKMSAQEVIQRYQDGERDFRRLDLRGHSFKGQNLSGADFSKADIKSTNFAKANLSQTNFSGAIGGIQKRWWSVQQLLAGLMGLLSGSLSGFCGASISLFFISITSGWWLVGLFSSLLVAILMLSLAGQGFTSKVVSTIWLVITGSVIFAAAGVAFRAIDVDGAAFYRAGTTAGAVSVAGVGVLAIAIAITGAGAVAGTTFRAGAGTGAVAFAVFAFAITASGRSGALLVDGTKAATVVIVAVIITTAISLFSLYIAWQTCEGNEKFDLLRIWGNALGGIGGTSFVEANLTGANFDGSTLKSTNLRQAILTQVSWKDAISPDFARWGTSILANNKIRRLLVSHNGAGEDYQDLNLSGVDLAAANLSGANFKRANLNGSILRHANLQNANLRETLCIGTDFTKVDLTGVCLQGWNIDRSTILDKVECQFVYLLEKEKENDKEHRERRPQDPDKQFESGDIEKLYGQSITTVELLPRGGLNRQAFQVAFEQLMAEHPDITLDDIQSIAKRGNDVQVTLSGDFQERKYPRLGVNENIPFRKFGIPF
jgi:uncharacterized protein YjbI with pentapeptide repeats